MKRIASPLFESTQMAQYSFWFVFGIAAMPACRRMYVFAATASQEWKSLIKRSKPLVTPFEGLQEALKAYNGPIGR